MAEKELQVKRMALNRQAAMEFSLREPPKLRGLKPDDISAYNEAWHQWWEDTQNAVRSILAMKLEDVNTRLPQG